MYSMQRRNELVRCHITKFVKSYFLTRPKLSKSRQATDARTGILRLSIAAGFCCIWRGFLPITIVLSSCEQLQKITFCPLMLFAWPRRRRFMEQQQQQQCSANARLLQCCSHMPYSYETHYQFSEKHHP